MTKNESNLTLSVTTRTLFGKKLKKLRKEGQIPANIFGADFKSLSVSVPLKDFTAIYKIAKETGVVYIKHDKEEIPVLIGGVQRHPVNDLILHVDFRKIDLKKKVEAQVPVKTTGVSEAVSQKAGVLLYGTQSLTVESLPKDIPHEIVVDISSIKELGQEIKVGDLPKSTSYEIKEPADRVVVSVVEHKEQSVTPETTSAAPEITTAAPLEGEAATTEGTPTPTKEGEKAQTAPQSDKKTPPEKK